MKYPKMTRQYYWAGIAICLIPFQTTVADEPTAKKPIAISSITIWEGYREWTTAVAFSPDGKTIAVGSYDLVELRDAVAEAKPKKIAVTGGFVRSLAYSPNGAVLAVGTYQTVTLLDRDGAELRTLKGHRGYVLGVAFSPDGKLLATASEDETARIWNVADGTEIRKFTDHRLPATAVAFSHDGNRIVSTDGDAEQPRKRGLAYVWERQTGKRQLTLNGHTRGVNCALFSPDGKQLVTGSTDETIRIWDAETGKLVKTLEGHSRPVNCLVFAPAGHVLASGGGGRFKGKYHIILWNTSIWKRLTTVDGHKGRITALAFSPDGKKMVSASYDKTVRIWNVASVTKKDAKK